jgi:3-phenylpropionate/trans-cinnamate dioxygenase ferredoxin subunit
MDGQWTRIAGVGDVADGEVAPIEFMGLSLALYHIDGAFFCTDNVCSHAFALLSDGWLEGHLIECPLHNGQFDVRTGKGMGPPITADSRAYPIRVEGDDILVSIE